jgi:hypothetical protein
LFAFGSYQPLTKKWMAASIGFKNQAYFRLAAAAPFNRHPHISLPNEKTILPVPAVFAKPLCARLLFF